VPGDIHPKRKSNDPHRHRGFSGLFFDEFDPGSAWIRDCAKIVLPTGSSPGTISVFGHSVVHPQAHGREAGCPGLQLTGPDGIVRLVEPDSAGVFRVDLPAYPRGGTLRLKLLQVSLTNILAWAGRVSGIAAFQRYRAQHKNRQLRIDRVEVNGEVVFDFSNRHSPRNLSIVRRSLPLGINVTGYLTADLGIGESARCMVRAADAAGLPVALINLKLPVKSSCSDETYAGRLQQENPHGVNVIHLDPPGAPDVDHHHGRAFSQHRYTIGYWAWELPEFPDAWMPYFAWYDEIWCPSDFVREAVALKSPVPVITMPHAIAFARPTDSVDALRARLGLPVDRFLFLFLYDLNSYSARKNPRAVLEAFRLSNLQQEGAALVIKVHGAEGNEAELAELKHLTRDLPGTTFITTTLSRLDLYALEAACDCFVSLHRSEGFGLSVAECMYLGKPVIATDWSATAEYLNETNGAPVRARLVTLEHNVGPYARGQTWADPDVNHAAEWMVRIRRNPELRQALGMAARATMEERYSPLAIGTRYRRRLESIALT
jgi:glycosyltransferase involved in cell wall biosynthesis